MADVHSAMKSSRSSAFGCFLFFPHSFPHIRHLGIRNQAMLTRQRVGGCSGLGHQRSGTLKCLQYTDRPRFAALVSFQRHPTPCRFQPTDTPPYPHPRKSTASVCCDMRYVFAFLDDFLLRRPIFSCYLLYLMT